MSNKLIFLLILFPFCTLFSQENKNTLTAEEFLKIVKTYHPVVLQTNINIQKSEADILAAKANFDPTFNLYKAEKTFNGTPYYNDISTEVNIPTWFGIDVYGGVENLSGEKINNSETKGKSSFLGVSIPLAKNLLIDKRRAALKQAKIFRDMSQIEQTAAVNDILYEGISAYYDWSNTYEAYLLAEDVLNNAKARIVLIQKSYDLGEKPAIDIVEAQVQLQSFELLRNEKYLDFKNAGLELTNFLWLQNRTPYSLSESVIPTVNFEVEKNRLDADINLNELLIQAEDNHPLLKVYDQKLNVLDIERRLKFQNLLPKVDFNYNFLNKGYSVENYFSQNPLFQNNFQYGLKIEFPIFFREGRAAYKLTKLKISETQLQQIQKGQEISVKIKSYFNEYSNLKEQIALQNEININYKKLLRAEEIRFQNGESSLFLINARENKVFESMIKTTDLNFKYLKSIYKLYWSAGILK